MKVEHNYSIWVGNRKREPEHNLQAALDKSVSLVWLARHQQAESQYCGAAIGPISGYAEFGALANESRMSGQRRRRCPLQAQVGPPRGPPTNHEDRRIAPSQPLPALPAGYPGSTTASLLPTALPAACRFLRHTPAQSLSGLESYPPFAHTLTGAVARNSAATRSGLGRPFRPHPAAGCRSLWPTSRQRTDALPVGAIQGNRPRSQPAGGHPFCPLRPERLPSLLSRRSLARRASASRNQETSGWGKPYGLPFRLASRSTDTLQPARAPFQPSRPALLPPEGHPVLWRPNNLPLTCAAEGGIGCSGGLASHCLPSPS